MENKNQNFKKPIKKFSKPKVKKEISAKQSKVKKLHSVIAELSKLWPKAIFIKADEIKPLNIGIHELIINQLPENFPFTKSAVRAAIRRYVFSMEYHESVLKYKHRVDLNGKITCDFNEEEIKYHKESIDSIKEKKAAILEAKKKELEAKKSLNFNKKRNKLPNVIVDGRRRSNSNVDRKPRIILKKDSVSTPIQKFDIDLSEYRINREVKVLILKEEKHAIIKGIEDNGRVKIQLKSGLTFSLDPTKVTLL